MTRVECEREGLLRAVCESPRDDVPRLIFADWCEDSGNVERAELIRGQINGSILPARFVLTDEGSYGVYPTCYGFSDGRPSASMPHVDWMRRAMVGSEDYVDQLPVWLSIGMDVGFTRGFIDEIRCPLEWWLSSGKGIVSHYPVTRIVVTNRTAIDVSGVLPGEVTGSVCWWNQREIEGSLGNELPPEVFCLLRGGRSLYTMWMTYDSPHLAADALSDALLEFASG